MRVYIQKCLAEKQKEEEEAREIVLTYKPGRSTSYAVAPTYGPFRPREVQLNYGTILTPNPHENLEACRKREIENFDKWYTQQVAKISETLSLVAPPSDEEPSVSRSEQPAESDSEQANDDSLSSDVDNLMGLLIEDRASTPEPEDPYLLRPYLAPSSPSYIV